MRICATYKNLHHKDEKELTPRSEFDTILLFDAIAPLRIVGIQEGSGADFLLEKFVEICCNF